MDKTSIVKKDLQEWLSKSVKTALWITSKERGLKKQQIANIL